MKMDPYVQIYLWNRDIDALVRVLQRLEYFSICSKKVLKAHEMRLEEIRAELNADFSETMGARERSDYSRLNRQRTQWEKQTPKPTENH